MAILNAGETMKHVSMMDLADFARDTASPVKQEAIRGHLESGCDGCQKTVGILKTIVKFAEQERSCEPPASALRIAHSYFSPLQMASAMPEGIEMAKLAFDSFTLANVSGKRGSTVGVPRQLLYKSGTICIDIRLEPKPGSNYVVLVGQLIDAKEPLLGSNDISVSLFGSEDKLSETNTNKFGEFYFGFQSAKHMQLFFGMQSKALIVPLPETHTEAA